MVGEGEILSDLFPVYNTPANHSFTNYFKMLILQGSI